MSREKQITMPRSSTLRRTLVDDATELNTRTGEDQAAEAVSIIVASCVKKADVDETEMIIRIRQLQRLLRHYPISVVEEITDPFFGIIGRQKFIPTPAELKAFADRLLHIKADRLTQTKNILQQIEDRRPRLTREERERRVAMAEEVRAKIAQTANRMQLRSNTSRNCESKRGLP